MTKRLLAGVSALALAFGASSAALAGGNESDDGNITDVAVGIQALVQVTTGDNNQDQDGDHEDNHARVQDDVQRNAAGQMNVAAFTGNQSWNQQANQVVASTGDISF